MDELTVDITRINIKNEGLKLKNKKAEKDLLSSISEHGIKDPLIGLFEKDIFILIDGFKRYRCCKKLQVNIIPIEVIGNDEANCFIKTLKISNAKSLHILEQARFIKQLRDNHNMTIESIGHSLGKSRFWVSSRLRLLQSLSPLVERKIFDGSFPVYNAMGLLHQVKNKSFANNNEIDEFVTAVSGKGLTINDINLLGEGYFKGGNEFKKQIQNGHFAWTINKLKDANKHELNLSDNGKRILSDLEIITKYIGRIIFKLPKQQNNNEIYSMGGLLAEGILNKLDKFQIILNTFIQEVKNDQQRQGKCGLDTSSARSKGQ